MFESLQPAPSPRSMRISTSVRHALAAADDEAALLVVEIDGAASIDAADLAFVVSHVTEIARSSIRKADIIEQLDSSTLAILLSGSGRIGMTRVADAIRQRVAAQTTTITIGAIHTEDARKVDFDDLVAAALVHLDTARAAGGNRTNWSDWSCLPA